MSSSATRANDFSSKDIQSFRCANVIKEEKYKENDGEIVQSMSTFTLTISFHWNQERVPQGLLVIPPAVKPLHNCHSDVSESV